MLTPKQMFGILKMCLFYSVLYVCVDFKGLFLHAPKSKINVFCEKKCFGMMNPPIPVVLRAWKIFFGKKNILNRWSRSFFLKSILIYLIKRNALYKSIVKIIILHCKTKKIGISPLLNRSLWPKFSYFRV